MIDRLPVAWRADAALYMMVGVAFVSGAVLAVASRWGQNVYPTRTVTVTRPAARIGNSSSVAQVNAVFDAKPAQAQTGGQNCPGTLREYTDGSSWYVLVCTR